MASGASLMRLKSFSSGTPDSYGVEQDNVVHGIVLAVVRPQGAAILPCAGGQQVVFQGYALIDFTVAVSIVPGLLSCRAVDADAFAEAEQDFNLFVLTLEGGGIDFGYDDRRQQ